jgi:hypothetical protein
MLADLPEPARFRAPFGLEFGSFVDCSRTVPLTLRIEGEQQLVGFRLGDIEDEDRDSRLFCCLGAQVISIGRPSSSSRAMRASA